MSSGDPRALTGGEIAGLPARLPAWRVEAECLVRSVTAPDFATGIAWVVAVADAAEAMDHHPDIDIRYRTITFRLSTHDLGGLSTWDIELACRIDAVVGSAV